MERQNGTISPAEAASLLQWWNDAGVDCLVDEVPHDWLHAASPVAKTSSKAASMVAVPEQTEPLPDQLGLFHAYLASDERLPFHTPSAPRVCPSGDPASGLMFVTDMPASEDFDTGVMLAGEAGRLFDRMLAAIGRNRESIYLASLSCLRAPGGGFTADNAAQCARILRHHIGLVAPKAVMVLGDTVSKALFGSATMQARGRWHDIPTQSGPVAALVSFHPSYLLDQPSAKRHAWTDLQLLAGRLTQ